VERVVILIKDDELVTENFRMEKLTAKVLK